MIKFRIKPKIEEGDRCKFGKVFKRCQDCKFFDIFLDNLHKMKNNLGQEHVKREGKIRKTAPDFPGKMTVFPVLTLLFHLSLPKIWLSYSHKNYISEMSNNRAICWKSFMMLSLRLWIW